MNRRTFFKGFSTILTFSAIKPYWGKSRELVKSSDFIYKDNFITINGDTEFFVSADGGKTYEPLGVLSDPASIKFEIKRSDELMSSIDESTKKNIKSLAEDVASYKNMPTEKVYEEIIFPITYHPHNKRELESLGII
jgi:hypothetical protein